MILDVACLVYQEVDERYWMVGVLLLLNEKPIWPIKMHYGYITNIAAIKKSTR